MGYSPFPLINWPISFGIDDVLISYAIKYDNIADFEHCSCRAIQLNESLSHQYHTTYRIYCS